MKRKTKITIETERHLSISRSNLGVVSRCDQCREDVRMLRPEVAATMADVSVRTIYRWVEAEKVHYKETPDGLLLICLNSLVRDPQAKPGE
jgi:hypothetical protein